MGRIQDKFTLPKRHIRHAQRRGLTQLSCPICLITQDNILQNQNQNTMRLKQMISLLHFIVTGRGDTFKFFLKMLYYVWLVSTQLTWVNYLGKVFMQ